MTDYEFEQDFERTPIEFYNEFRSRDIEFEIYGTDYNAAFPRPPVKNIVFMFCDWDSLFGEDGLCCGNTETITLGEGETEREIDLKSIPAWRAGAKNLSRDSKRRTRNFENMKITKPGLRADLNSLGRCAPFFRRTRIFGMEETD